MADALSSRQGAARRRGRTIGVVVFGLLVSTFTAVCSVQIIVQAWASPPASGSGDCREGTLDLIRAIRRARDAASRATGGEREAVERFRKALQPEWAVRPALTARCADDPAAVRSLGDVDRLRYAEEHALRYEALDVASRRRRVEAIEHQLESR